MADRLACDAMRLAVLMERTHAPYAKWFGAAFARLDGAELVTPARSRALAATDWASREQALLSDSTDLLEDAGRREALRDLYAV